MPWLTIVTVSGGETTVASTNAAGTPMAGTSHDVKKPMITVVMSTSVKPRPKIGLKLRAKVENEKFDATT